MSARSTSRWATCGGIVLHHVTGAGAAHSDPAPDQIVWNFRTPRVVLAALAGAGLAVSGAVLQTVVPNPLADPIVLGFSYGATLGAVLVITLGGGAVPAGLGVSAAASSARSPRARWSSPSDNAGDAWRRPGWCWPAPRRFHQS